MYQPQTLSKNLIDKFIEEYTINKLSIKKIAKKYNSSEETISKYLQLAGVKINSKCKYTDADIILWKKLYLQGISLTQISKEYHTSRDTISKYLTLNGITVINRQNLLRFDETIFDNIDTEEKAYWLGFIYADGCIYYNIKGKYRFEISLKESDYNHLLKFASFLKLDPLHIKKKKINLNHKTFFAYRIVLSNEHFPRILNSYGCTPRKSLTLKFPDENIFKSKDLIRHFIRGYFDGDGCFSYRRVSNTDNYKPFISILGTFEFLQSIMIYITSYTTLINLKTPSLQTYALNIREQGNLPFMNFIYNDANIYLDRKYNRYLFFKQGCRSSKELEELLESEIGEDWDVNTEIS